MAPSTSRAARVHREHDDGRRTVLLDGFDLRRRRLCDFLDGYELHRNRSRRIEFADPRPDLRCQQQQGRTEFQVNTAAAGGQYRSQIAILASGDFVIAWEDQGETGGDTSGEATRAQMYHRDGSKIGGEFIVNTSTAGDQGEPAITALSNGGFVVTWNDASGTGGDTTRSVKAQLYDAGGQRVGGEFLVNTLTTGDQDEVSVASLAGGGFVATWQDNSFLRGDRRALARSSPRDSTTPATRSAARFSSTPGASTSSTTSTTSSGWRMVVSR